MAKFEPSGRSADTFSFGCILLEILLLHERGSFDQLRKHLTADPSFHSNLHQLENWLQLSCNVSGRRECHLKCEIELMLSSDPKRRPSARELLHSLTTSNLSHNEASAPSIFGSCCENILVSESGRGKMRDMCDRTINKMANMIQDLERTVEREKSAALTRGSSETKRRRNCYGEKRTTRITEYQ